MATDHGGGHTAAADVSTSSHSDSYGAFDYSHSYSHFDHGHQDHSHHGHDHENHGHHDQDNHHHHHHHHHHDPNYPYPPGYPVSGLHRDYGTMPNSYRRQSGSGSHMENFARAVFATCIVLFFLYIFIFFPRPSRPVNGWPGPRGNVYDSAWRTD
ncbi:hypothetical protein NA57DRAFT_56480 [Rhizodiscina lignyota]|uniref:Uncharacterized protein n=1 Tax=Rhizodiscina lignyota TaxID=1504668 RepID=A0A9P4IFS7_9PEZI|nr:hypothetical protein NA57DRAFT_56480 [Rhizodiscina lignyota]